MLAVVYCLNGITFHIAVTLDNRFICLVKLYAIVLENCPKSGPGSDHKQFLNHETAGRNNERHSLRADFSDEDSESARW